jgi:hypothetical protein
MTPIHNASPISLMLTLLGIAALGALAMALLPLGTAAMATEFEHG